VDIGVRHRIVSSREHAESVTFALAADAGFAGSGHCGSSPARKPLEVVMAAKRPDFERKWS
jgi:hypothetical protein